MMHLIKSTKRALSTKRETRLQKGCGPQTGLGNWSPSKMPQEHPQASPTPGAEVYSQLEENIRQPRAPSEETKQERCSQTPDATTCDICVEKYDEDEHLPRILKCFHTFCTTCLDHRIGNNNRWCPFCDTDFKAKTTRDIPVNRTILDFMNYIGRLVSGEDDYSSQGDQQLESSYKREINHPAQRMLQQLNIFPGHQYNRGISSTGSCSEDDESYYELGESPTTKTNNTKVTCDAKICGVCCEDFEVEGGGGGMRIPRLLECLHTVCDICLQHMIKDDNKKCPFCRRIFKVSLSEDIPVNTSVVDFIQHINHLESCMSSITGNGSNCNIESPSRSEFEHDIYRSESPSLQILDQQKRITVDELLEKGDFVKQLVDEGRIFAIQLTEGKRKRTAKITNTDDGRLCLHHLSKKKSLPQHSYFVELDDIMDLIDPSSRLAFIDLGVCGSNLGRLYIRLPKDTKGTLQFSLLCTGVEGPTYANSNLLQVWGKGHDGERVLFGDYESNNGSGGKSLIPGLREEEEENYRERCLSGTVVGNWDFGDEVGAQFFIHTKDQPWKEVSPGFGFVEEGLQILTEAVSQYPNVRYISILDCGLVVTS